MQLYLLLDDFELLWLDFDVHHSSDDRVEQLLDAMIETMKGQLTRRDMCQIFSHLCKDPYLYAVVQRG